MLGVAAIAMKRWFPATRMSMTAFGAIVGTEIGNEVTSLDCGSIRPIADVLRIGRIRRSIQTRDA
jgi:hypothetical protein